MTQKTLSIQLLLYFILIGPLSGCISTAGEEHALTEQVGGAYYLTGTVDTEKEGVKEYDCSHRILDCMDDYEAGEKVLKCLADTPTGTLEITGGVKSNNLGKRLCQ